MSTETPRNEGTPQLSVAPAGAGATRPDRRRAGLGLRSPAVWAGLALLVGAAASFGFVERYFGFVLDKKPIYPADGRLLTALPRETDSWVQAGPDRRETAEVEAVLGTENYLSRTYIERNPANPDRPIVLDFHAAYYTGMIDTVPHVPDRCFVGGGLSIGEIVGDLPLPLDASRWRAVEDVPEHLQGKLWETRLSNRSDLPGSYVTLPRDPHGIRMRTMRFVGGSDRPIYAGYFFIANGGWVSRAEGVRLLAFDLRTRYAYYCKVQVTSDRVDSGEELAAAAARLLDEMLPELMRCVPDWRAVEEGAAAPGREL